MHFVDIHEAEALQQRTHRKYVMLMEKRGTLQQLQQLTYKRAQVTGSQTSIAKLSAAEIHFASCTLHVESVT